MTLETIIAALEEAFPNARVTRRPRFMASDVVMVRKSFNVGARIRLRKGEIIIDNMPAAPIIGTLFGMVGSAVSSLFNRKTRGGFKGEVAGVLTRMGKVIIK